LLSRNPGADVVICAHTGLESASSFGDLWRGDLVGATVRVRLWRVPFAQLPTEPDAQMSWLFEQWQRVDDWIEDQKAG
jgi:hypothetical protein